MGFMEKLGGAIIGGVGTLGGAALQARAANKATDAQAKAQADALDFTKQQEADKLKIYNDAASQWQQQYAAQQARRDALLASYGFSVPQTPAMAPASPLGGAAAGPGAAPSTAGMTSMTQLAQPRTVPYAGAAASASPEAQGGDGVSLGAAAAPALGDVWKWAGSGNRYGLA